MLVLGRKAKQSLRIGDEIVVTILAVDGDRVKIGIEAPSDVRILRQELYLTIKKENLRAAQTAAQRNSKLLPALEGLLKAEKK